MKYVILKDGLPPHIVLLPEWVNHSDAVNPSHPKPVSAGFCTVYQKGWVKVHGESTTLKLTSRPQDAEIIQLAMTLMGAHTCFANMDFILEDYKRLLLKERGVE